MKTALILLAAAGLLLASPAHAHVCFEAGSAGTVEAVREIQAPRDLHAFDPEVLEHKLRPETEEVLVVRLDAGPLVVLDQARSRRLQAGERVRVMPDGAGFCATPLAALDQREF